jgi:hypothetical protein
MNCDASREQLLSWDRSLNGLSNLTLIDNEFYADTKIELIERLILSKRDSTQIKFLSKTRPRSPLGNKKSVHRTWSEKRAEKGHWPALSTSCIATVQYHIFLDSYIQ